MLGSKQSIPQNPSGSIVNYVQNYVQRNGKAKLLI
jgi:hypothetical protein